MIIKLIYVVYMQSAKVRLEVMSVEIEKLLEELKKKSCLNDVIASKEFTELVITLEDQSDITKEVAKKVAKEMGWNGKAEKVKITEPVKEIIEFVYLQGYTVGLNVGRILTSQAIESVIRMALAEIDREESDLRLKTARIISYFFKDEKEVNEVEKNIIKLLREQGFSYREIAKVVGRSLETIHRHLKDINEDRKS